LADAGKLCGAAEMQRLRQSLEILHLPDGETNHKENLSQQTGKAICFYRGDGLVWNCSRVARLPAGPENQPENQHFGG
jgi:hypothetical protein